MTNISVVGLLLTNKIRTIYSLFLVTNARVWLVLISTDIKIGNINRKS